MSTPRIRSDLQAMPAEEAGIKYFDVSDPKSGARMRMYDFEWLIAERMDGRRPFDEVASWARERLSIQPSASDIEEFAHKLRDLGFFDLDHAEEPARAAPNAPTMMAQAPTLPSSGNGAGKSVPANDSAIPLETVAEGPRNTSPQATAPTMAMPMPVLERPPVAIDRPTANKQAVPAQVVDLPSKRTVVDAEEAPAKSSAGSMIGIVLVLALVGGVFAYVKLMSNGAAKVVTVVATPREVVRLYDGAAAVRKSEGQTLAFGESGKVSDVVAAGTEAKAGMPLATLDSYTKIEKELADVKDRAAFYEKQLATAKAKNEDEAAKAAESKVAEKKKLLGELEARAGKVRLLAPGPGAVAQVMVQAGGEAKAGEPVVKLADKRSLADFKLAAADAAALKAGQTVTLQPSAGGATLAGRVAKVDGDSISVELVDESSAKPGDSVRLVRARVPNVVPVPAAAVVKRQGVDVVYVLADGTVHERKITIVDKSGSETLVGSGLQSGDQVVSGGAESLKDGQKAAQ